MKTDDEWPLREKNNIKGVLFSYNPCFPRSDLVDECYCPNVTDKVVVRIFEKNVTFLVPDTLHIYNIGKLTIISVYFFVLLL